MDEWSNMYTRTGTTTHRGHVAQHQTVEVPGLLFSSRVGTMIANNVLPLGLGRDKATVINRGCWSFLLLS